MEALDRMKDRAVRVSWQAASSPLVVRDVVLYALDYSIDAVSESEFCDPNQPVTLEIKQSSRAKTYVGSMVRLQLAPEDRATVKGTALQITFQKEESILTVVPAAVPEHEVLKAVYRKEHR